MPKRNAGLQSGGKNLDWNEATVAGRVTQDMTDTVSTHWRTLRFVLLLPNVLFLCFIPGVAVAVRAFGPVGKVAIFVVYTILVVTSGYLSSTWLCPNCGKPFNRKPHFGPKWRFYVVLAYRRRCGYGGARGATSN
jgi:hypothetical protein